MIRKATRFSPLRKSFLLAKLNNNLCGFEVLLTSELMNIDIHITIILSSLYYGILFSDFLCSIQKINICLTSFSKLSDMLPVLTRAIGNA